MSAAYADAFLRDILDAPEDDVPRLVYADWLEEQGDAERAEFIRVQIELARPGPVAARAALERRERELLEAHGDEWAAPLAPLVSEWVFRRGFVDEVHAGARAFLAETGRLFALAPLRHLRLHWSHVLPYQRGRLAVALADCPLLARLDTLDLSFNYLGSDGVRALVASEHLTRLAALDLSTNRVGDRGLRALAASPLLGRLRRLDLSHNDFDPEGACALAAALGALAARGTPPRLQALDLRDNAVGEAGRRAVALSPWLRGVTRL
jgi:uncharacterized protein (TIGR02996 family)